MYVHVYMYTYILNVGCMHVYLYRGHCMHVYLNRLISNPEGVSEHVLRVGHSGKVIAGQVVVIHSGVR